MKVLRRTTVALLSALSTAPAVAQDVNFSLGAGTYGTTHSFDDKYKESEFGGYALTATAV